MNKFLAVAAIAAFSWAAQANAAVVYTSGPVSGADGANTINQGFAVTDSFTLSTATTITGFTFGGWTSPWAPITAVDWGISSSPDFADEGTTSLTAVYHSTGNDYFDVSEYTGSIGAMTLAAGTYWFTLQNAQAGDAAYWDANYGTSSAYQQYYGEGGYPTGGHSFSILGEEASPTPEPASWAMMVGGFGVIGGAMRSRRTKAAVRFG